MHPFRVFKTYLYSKTDIFSLSIFFSYSHCCVKEKNEKIINLELQLIIFMLSDRKNKVCSKKKIFPPI